MEHFDLFDLIYGVKYAFTSEICISNYGQCYRKLFSYTKICIQHISILTVLGPLHPPLDSDHQNKNTNYFNISMII